jgi:RNA polymerase sigma-70 factor (ECF subfamily)
METAVEQAAIRSALDELTPDQREVVVYRFFAGLSPREIGVLLDRSEGSIRALQFRALQTLRASLSPQVELLRAPGIGS